MHSARTGIYLFCLNLLVAAVLVGTFVWPSSSSARRQPAPVGATPTTAPFDVGALPDSSPTGAPIHALATTTITTHAAAPTATRIIPTATPIPLPTVGIAPTPTPTVSNWGG